MDHVVALVLTEWVRNSRFQLHNGGARPSAESLFTSACGMIVLKAELKSKTHMGVLVLRACEDRRITAAVALAAEQFHLCIPGYTDGSQLLCQWTFLTCIITCLSKHITTGVRAIGW